MVEEYIPAQDYLESKRQEIIERIEKLAQSGELEDAVKLKANQILLNKILPDKTRLDIGYDKKSPIELIMEQMKQIEDKT
jgi:hypothetical protein